MIAVTLTQPYASLIAYGEKRLETRTWKPDARHEGTAIAIHAAKSLAPVGGRPGLAQLCLSQPFTSAIAEHNDGFRRWISERGDLRQHFPFGAIVAEAIFEKAVPGEHAARRLLEHAAGATSELSVRYVKRELAFGGFAAGRWAWVLREVYALPEPIICRGGRGLWAVPEDIAQRLAETALAQGRDHL